MCSALYLTLIEQLLRGRISLVQNRKRRRERRWGTFLGHLRGGWLGIISRSHAELWKRWIPPASRPSPDPAAGYSAFPGVQSQVSSEIRLLWRSLPEMECYSAWPKEAPPPVGRLIFWSSVCEKMITKENWSEWSVLVQLGRMRQLRSSPVPRGSEQPGNVASATRDVHRECTYTEFQNLSTIKTTGKISRITYYLDHMSK